MIESDWAKPCPDAEDPVFDVVHEWVTLRAQRYRSRTIPMDRPDLVDTISEEESLHYRDVSDAVRALLDSEPPKMRKVDRGFLVTEKFLSTLPESRLRRGERGSLVAKRLGAEDAVYPAEASAASRTSGSISRDRRQGVKHPSAQKRVELCRNVFPSLVEDHDMETIPRHLYWKPLYKNVQRLEYEYRVDTPFVHRMMEEFVRHPEWCRRSPRPAWRVFISRWQQLLKLVQAKQHRDPGNRRYSEGRDWLARPVRHNRGKEYWLGKYA